MPKPIAPPTRPTYLELWHLMKAYCSIADATFSMNSVPGDKSSVLTLDWSSSFIFSRRLRCTSNFAKGALRWNVEKQHVH